MGWRVGIISFLAVSLSHYLTLRKLLPHSVIIVQAITHLSGRDSNSYSILLCLSIYPLYKMSYKEHELPISTKTNMTKTSRIRGFRQDKIISREYEI